METNMQCPNCGNQTSSSTNKCRICGVSLNTHSAPTKTGIPNWAKDLLTGMGIGLVAFTLLGAGYYFFYPQPQQFVSQPTEIRTMLVEPTQVPSTATKVPLETFPSETPTLKPTASPIQTLTPTSVPTQTPTPTAETQYCDVFEEINMTVVYMDWFSGRALEFYIKMPGGVPGLEKKIPGASGEWHYRAKIGDYSSAQCDIISGYKERLYCQIILPSKYESAVHPISLYASTCDEDLLSGEDAFLPEIKK